jgi:hypothetical protein
MEELIYAAALIGAIAGAVYCTVKLLHNHNLGKRRNTPTPED